MVQTSFQKAEAICADLLQYDKFEDDNLPIYKQTFRAVEMRVRKKEITRGASQLDSKRAFVRYCPFLTVAKPVSCHLCPATY
jgi:hypothetical protein